MRGSRRCWSWLPLGGSLRSAAWSARVRGRETSTLVGIVLDNRQPLASRQRTLDRASVAATLSALSPGNLYAYTGDNPINYTDPTGALTSNGLIAVGAGVVIGVARILACPQSAGASCTVAVVAMGAGAGLAIEQWLPFGGELPNPMPGWESQIWRATCGFVSIPTCYGFP